MISTVVINVFQLNYDYRLRSWYDLRQTLQNADTKTKCLEIDTWWQSAPIVNHYLHPHEIDAWPTPWELLYDNEYCHIARGLGMIYTLVLTGIKDVDFSLGKDDNNEDVALVIVDRAKYVLNYWPNMVVNINLKNFKITDSLSLKNIITKIGEI
jgi:hypothetical protein